MTGEQNAKQAPAGDPGSDLLEKSERELDQAISELRGDKTDEAASDPLAREAAVASASEAPQHPLRRSSDNRIIMSIPVNVDIVLGRTEMPVHELMALERGATVMLDRRIGEPVDVVVSGRRIARGEIIVLEEDSTRFGIKLTDVADN